MNFRERIVIFFSSGFYIGKVPVVPGTFGSLAGLVFCFMLSRLDTVFVFSGIAFTIVFSIWIADQAERLLARKDPGEIVIDEIAGMMTTMAGLPFTVLSAVSGFMLFRILDILKPFPIRYLERRVPGGAGIVMDDVAAGIMGNVMLRVILHFTGV